MIYRNQFAIFLILSILLASIHFLLNYEVFETGPDGINQIDGAMNLYLGNDYVLSNGEYVKYWPPLYATFVSYSLYFFDGTFQAINLLNSLLIFSIIIAWIALYYCLIKILNLNAGTIPIILALSVGLLSLHVLRSPSSDAVYFLFLPIYILALVSFIFENNSLYIKFAALTLSAAALANTHNMGAIFILSSYIPAFFILLNQENKKVRLSLLTLACFIAAASWLAVRKIYQLSGSHPFIFFGAERELQDAIFDVFIGVSDLLFFVWPIGFSICALIAFLIFWQKLTEKDYSSSKENNIGLLLVSILVVFYTILIILFVSVEITSGGLGGRFALTAALVLLIASAIWASRKNSSKISKISILICAFLVIASNSARVAKYSYEIAILETYQWNRSVVETSEEVNEESILELRSTRCHDSFCNHRTVK